MFIITAALFRYTENKSTWNIFVITTAVITESNTGKKNVTKSESEHRRNIQPVS
jgi:hypothetical protein